MGSVDMRTSQTTVNTPSWSHIYFWFIKKKLGQSGFLVSGLLVWWEAGQRHPGDSWITREKQVSTLFCFAQIFLTNIPQCSRNYIPRYLEGCKPGNYFFALTQTQLFGETIVNTLTMCSHYEQSDYFNILYNFKQTFKSHIYVAYIYITIRSHKTGYNST